MTEVTEGNQEQARARFGNGLQKIGHRSLSHSVESSHDPVDGGQPFRWIAPDGSVHYDLPELTRRVRNAWETTMDLDPAEGDDVPKRTEITARMLTDDEWKSVCEILDVLPSVYAQRDQARGMAMRLEEELAGRPHP